MDMPYGHQAWDRQELLSIGSASRAFRRTVSWAGCSLEQKQGFSRRILFRLSPPILFKRSYFALAAPCWVNVQRAGRERERGNGRGLVVGVAVPGSLPFLLSLRMYLLNLLRL
jgi:hypothetical protein